MQQYPDNQQLQPPTSLSHSNMNPLITFIKVNLFPVLEARNETKPVCVAETRHIHLTTATSLTFKYFFKLIVTLVFYGFLSQHLLRHKSSQLTMTELSSPSSVIWINPML